MNALIPAIHFVLAALYTWNALHHQHDGIGALNAAAACVFLALGFSTVRRYWRHG